MRTAQFSLVLVDLYFFSNPLMERLTTVVKGNCFTFMEGNSVKIYFSSSEKRSTLKDKKKGKNLFSLEAYPFLLALTLFRREFSKQK